MLSLSGQDSRSQTAVLGTLTPLAAHPLAPTSQSKGSICFSSASACKGLAPALAPWSLDSALARSALGPAHLGKMQTDTGGAEVLSFSQLPGLAGAAGLWALTLRTTVLKYSWRNSFSCKTRFKKKKTRSALDI